MKQTFLNQPSESEHEILSVLWKNGPSSVRFVNEELNKHRKVGYTTTLKILQIMHQKKLVARELKGKLHIYTALIEEKTFQNRLIDRVLDSAFDGSVSRLVMQTLGNHKTSKQELDEIKKLIEKIEKDQES